MKKHLNDTSTDVLCLKKNMFYLPAMFDFQMSTVAKSVVVVNAQSKKTLMASLVARTMWDPQTVAKLVYNFNFTMVYGTYNYS